jgi:hypothetical protein
VVSDSTLSALSGANVAALNPNSNGRVNPDAQAEVMAAVDSLPAECGRLGMHEHRQTELPVFQRVARGGDRL